MKTAGLVKNSFVDYPGQIAAVVFTQGCNYDCFFCHNRLLIPFKGDLISEEEVFGFLKKRAGLLDGVVVTGGEPALQPDLADFIGKVKKLGYLVKLDTNGSMPLVVEGLLGKGLLDYVAVDYKAPFDRYEEVCCTKCDTDAVRRTIGILAESGVEYELRTTFIPQLGPEDIGRMLEEIAPVGTFALQHYKMPANYKKEHRFLLNFDEHSEADYKTAVKTAEKFAKKVIFR